MYSFRLCCDEVSGLVLALAIDVEDVPAVRPNDLPESLMGLPDPVVHHQHGDRAQDHVPFDHQAIELPGILDLGAQWCNPGQNIQRLTDLEVKSLIESPLPDRKSVVPG